MADQTHCHICKRHLQKGGICCVICKAYIHVSCSGLERSKFYYDGFSCIQCAPENFVKEPNSTNRPTSRAPITTQKPTSTAPITNQKDTSPSTPETNLLPNATQSYPSPPAITTAPFDPWKLNDQELEIKINDIYKDFVNWIFKLISSKNKPGFQFIKLLNQQLLSLVEETPNSNVAMKAAMILPHLLLPKTKSETNGSNSKTPSRRIVLWTNVSLKRKLFNLDI